MKIRINKDLLTEYKDAVWKGFTIQEIISLILGGAAAIGVVFFLHRQFGIYPATAIYAAVPFALPPVLIGFFKYQGYMGPVTLIKEMLFCGRCSRLVWDEEEKAATPVFTMKAAYREQPNKKKGKRGRHGIYDQSGKAL